MGHRIVWILGAGFSKSLGGPLLDDLLQPDCLTRLWTTFPRDEFPRLAGALPEAVVWLFHYGRRFSMGRRPPRVWQVVGESLWRDAEDFLDFVDAAAASESAPARATLLAILNHHREDLFGNGGTVPEMKDVRAMARRLVAAECAAFLQNADLSTERWGPYLRWARGLVEARDTIITFNYDLVPEHLSRQARHLAVLLPGDSSAPRDHATILKLHGSVDWCRKGQGRFEAQGVESAFCCRCEADEMAIATPGRTKAEHAKDFATLWEAAAKAIDLADAVVFLGYRFPPSDAEARSRILMAIGLNHSPYLAIHTVLGPDTRNVDSARLRGLLRHTLRSNKEPRRSGVTDPRDRKNPNSYDLEQQPLFVEDFLSVVGRQAVLDLFKAQ